MKAFYDTNVALDVLLKREPFYRDSARVWTLAELRHVEGFVSATSFCAVFYIVQRLRGQKAAAHSVRTMLGIFAPAACDALIINQAIDSDLPDFEDAIQYFSAVHVGADCILTRDPGGFPGIPAVPVLSPTEFLAQLQME